MTLTFTPAADDVRSATVTDVNAAVNRLLDELEHRIRPARGLTPPQMLDVLEVAGLDDLAEAYQEWVEDEDPDAFTGDKTEDEDVVEVDLP